MIRRWCTTAINATTKTYTNTNTSKSTSALFQRAYDILANSTTTDSTNSECMDILAQLSSVHASRKRYSRLLRQNNNNNYNMSTTNVNANDESPKSINVPFQYFLHPGDPVFDTLPQSSNDKDSDSDDDECKFTQYFERNNTDTDLAEIFPSTKNSPNNKACLCVLTHMLRRNIIPTASMLLNVYKSVLRSYTLEGEIHNAKMIIQIIRKYDLFKQDSDAGVEVYNLFMECYGRAYRPLDASFVLFYTMQANGVKPNSESYLCVLRSLVWSKCKSNINSLSSSSNKNFGPLEKFTYNSQKGEASSQSILRRLFAHAKHHSIPLSADMYTLALHACDGLEDVDQIMMQMLDVKKDDKICDIDFREDKCEQLMSVFFVLLRDNQHQNEAEHVLTMFVKACVSIQKDESFPSNAKDRANMFLLYFQKFGLMPKPKSMENENT